MLSFSLLEQLRFCDLLAITSWPADPVAWEWARDVDSRHGIETVTFEAEFCEKNNQYFATKVCQSLSF